MAQKFQSKFLSPQIFLWISVFFSPKNCFDAEIMEKIATKTTLLFFGNIGPRIASHAFLTIWDPLKWAKIDLSENKIFQIFHFFSLFSGKSRFFQKLISLTYMLLFVAII